MAFTLNIFGLGVCCYMELWILMAWAGLYDQKDVCEREVFKAHCPYNEVVRMESALYGRMELGRCAQVDMGYIGCQKNVLLIADAKCSGRRTCEIPIPDDDFEATIPCYELKSFLQASYTCVKVLNADSRVCDDTQYLRTPDSSGYIARTIPSEGAAWCDDGAKPWLIEALPGQRINVTLYDFSLSVTGLSTGPGYSHEHEDVNICHSYVTIEETTPQRETVICGGKQRVDQVHLTNSNRILIHFNQPQERNDGFYFMIYYEIIGCPDIEPEPNKQFKRENDVLTINCPDTDESWQLICEGKTWIGSHKNCSSRVSFMEIMSGEKSGKLSRHAVIGILSGVAIVVAALFIIFGALFYRKWQKRSTHQMVEVPTISPISSPTKKYTCTDAEFIEDEDEVYLKPAPNFFPHHHHHHNHHRHLPSDDPLKPVPLPNKTNDYTERRNKKTDAGSPMKPTDMNFTKSKNDYTHIWEMPLPTPGEA